MAKKNNTKISIADMRGLINKSAGRDVAFDLKKTNPTEVKYWIPTGSTVLDSMICKGIVGGIPGGKISSIAGLPSTGKSYIATQISRNAQERGMTVVYFDSESAISPEFMEDCGVDLDKLLYVQARSVEFVFETIESIMANMDNEVLFIWDSLALTPCAADWEGDYNPQSNVALKSRICSKGLTKLVLPIADNGCAFLILNQLKTNITKDRWEAMTDPYVTPGGKSPKYSYSLEIWLTRRTSKAAYLEDAAGNLTGGEVKIEIKKSRFGTERRKCKFDIIWSNPPRIADAESWLDVIKKSDGFRQAGARAYLDMTGEGDWTDSFFQSKWMTKMEDPKFFEAAREILHEELVTKFAANPEEALMKEIGGEEPVIPPVNHDES